MIMICLVKWAQVCGNGRLNEGSYGVVYTSVAARDALVARMNKGFEEDPTYKCNVGEGISLDELPDGPCKAGWRRRLALKDGAILAIGLAAL